MSNSSNCSRGRTLGGRYTVISTGLEDVKVLPFLT